jgi:hypothetical protein
MPRGVCPACLKPIDRYKMLLVKEFPCPHCQQLIGTSLRFRVLMRLTTIGLATVVVFNDGLSFTANIIAWIVWWFIFNLTYIWLASILHLPRLELFRKKSDEFESLNLTK